jgi:hypothetical protein
MFQNQVNSQYPLSLASETQYTPDFRLDFSSSTHSSLDLDISHSYIRSSIKSSKIDEIMILDFNHLDNWTDWTSLANLSKNFTYWENLITVVSNCYFTAYMVNAPSGPFFLDTTIPFERCVLRAIFITQWKQSD